MSRDGGTYRGNWNYHEGRQRWEGNPADSAEVQDVMMAVKNKCGAEGGDRKHSLAMSKEHMEKMFEWSERQCPAESLMTAATDLGSQMLRIKHLEFRAFAATGWTCWGR